MGRPKPHEKIVFFSPQLPEKWYVTATTDVTNEILGKAGIHLLKMASAQLSRSRGGPRCMSMPFIRAE